MINYMPTKIYTGENVLIKNKDIFKKYGNRCFVITSPSSGKKSGALDDIVNIFKELDINYQIYDEVKQNPSVISCIEIGKLINQFNANFLVGVGGGSVLDTCKAAAVVGNNVEIDEDGLYQAKWKNKNLPYILIGTTAGTGAEVTKNAVLTKGNGMKQSIKRDDLYADYAFGDYRYTTSMPDSVRISTALDALAHMLESYFSNKANDISRAYCIQGIKILYPNLLLLKDKATLNNSQLQTVYDASILGGLAINITGTVFCHSFGYYLTESYNIAHGYACAVFENSLIDFELKNNEFYTNDFFKQLNIDCDEFKNTIACLLPNYNIELTKQDLEMLVKRYENNSSVKNTKGLLNNEDIVNIFTSVLD